MSPSRLNSLTVFCKVVDNFGDIGICWRLARQFAQEHQLNVTLWVDDLRSFQRICHEVIIEAETQLIQNITIRRWHDQHGEFRPAEITDIVIEFFGCELPLSYVNAMAVRVPKAVWINLEGLSAESWVEGCHALPSPHPRLPLTKYFFFPGFTDKTGGLLIEAGLQQQRDLFQRDPAAIASFLGQFGVTSSEMAATKVSLFCYPHAPLLALFDTWQRGPDNTICLVPAGVAVDALQTFFGKLTQHMTRGALTVRVIPFLNQPDYDKLLWACDVNFVRGEDSFVRAQWAKRPFIWHIYPQDNNLHHVKLKAFLQRLTARTDNFVDFCLLWNAAIDQPADLTTSWSRLQADLPQLIQLSGTWQQQLLANGNLASNLLRFAHKKKGLH
jgi:uncharacterized repeat protein (TIGR03837 family)